MPSAAERELDAVVQQPFAVHPAAYAGFVEKVRRRLLEHACADSAQHILTAAALENDVVDAGLVQQLTKQKARRPCADDRHLGAVGNHEGAIIAGARRPCPPLTGINAGGATAR